MRSTSALLQPEVAAPEGVGAVRSGSDGRARCDFGLEATSAVATGRVRAAGRIRVTIATPTSLADPAADPAETFERLWNLLPAFDGNNGSCFLTDDGGTFIKGQRLRVRGSPTAVIQAGRLVREVRNLDALRSSGIAVPEILLHAVETRLGVPVRALLVLRRVPSSRSLRDELRATHPDERAGLWEPLGRIVADMHFARIFHRDLTSRNILIQRLDASPEVVLIDCPRGAVDPPAARRGFLRRADLFRLGRSILHDGGTESEVREVLRVYGFSAADRLIAMIRKSLEAGGARPMRTKIWVGFGI